MTGGIIAGKRTKGVFAGAFETGPHRKKGRRKHTLREAPVFSLKKAENRLDDGLVMTTKGKGLPGGIGQVFPSFQFVKNLGQSLLRKEPQKKFEPQIPESMVDAMTTKTSGKIRNCRVGGVELGKGRKDEGDHGCLTPKTPGWGFVDPSRNRLAARKPATRRKPGLEGRINLGEG
jgi:hypothetical protein